VLNVGEFIHESNILFTKRETATVMIIHQPGNTSKAKESNLMLIIHTRRRTTGAAGVNTLNRKLSLG